MGFLPAAAAAAALEVPSLWVPGITPEPYDPTKIGPYVQNLIRGRESFWSDDFDINDAPSVGTYPWEADSATGTATTDPPVAGRIGILGLPTGASATGRCRVRHGNIAANGPFVGGNGRLRFGWMVNPTSLSTAAERFILRIGLTDSSNGAGGDDDAAIIFRYVDNVVAGNWECVCANAAVETAVDSGVAVATGWVYLEAEENAAGNSVDFYINLVKVATIATNTPTTGMALSAGIQKSIGTGNRNFQADFAYVLQRISPDRIPV